MQLAVIITSDPKGGDDALGRMFNGLALAHDAQRKGDEVEVVFVGAGTRWPGELAKLTHPANGLYKSVRESIKGASCGCAAVFGATESVKACGTTLLTDTPLDGTPGLSDLHSYVANGWSTLVF